MARASAEVAALDVLHRAGWRPVTRDSVAAWFDDRARHVEGCPCWRCQAALATGVDRVYRCLRAWGRTTAPPATPTAATVTDRRPLPERARVLRDTGLTMAQIAAELHCAASSVHRYLHSA